MAFGTGLPGRFDPMRFRGLPLRGKNELYEQAVLLDKAEVVAVLADHTAVTRELPRFVRFLHQVAAAAKFGILLYIAVVPDRQDDAQDRNDEHERNKDDLVPGAQPPLDTVEYLGEEIVHGKKSENRGQTTDVRLNQIQL